MSTNQDIIKKFLSATGGAVYRNESENRPAHALACDYADLVHHHNGRGTARQQKQPEPAEEPDYDAEGMASATRGVSNEQANLISSDSISNSYIRCNPGGECS